MVAVVSSALGCVSAAEHRRVVDDRNGLRERNTSQAEKIVRLEAEERHLSEEVAKNLEGFEDLRIEYQALDQTAPKRPRPKSIGLRRRIPL